MHALIAWAGFLGAWLLVAGPIYQAALELTDQQLDREEIEKLRNEHAPPRVSRWWWLVPPVWYAKQHKLADEYRTKVMSGMSESTVRSLVDYKGAASAWGLVGLGGFFIAVKETGELTEHYDWATWVFWALLVVFTVASIANTAWRIERARQIIASAGQRAA